MSYPLPTLLTVLFAFAGLLTAQRADFHDACLRLSSPTAPERLAAVNQIVALKGDIGPQMRVAFRSASATDRCGLFEAAEYRQDSALVEQALQTLSAKSADERVVASARAYLLALPDEKIAVDAEKLDEGSRAALREVTTFRLRRAMVFTLASATQKPGKSLDQFDTHRAANEPVLDTELLALIRLDPEFVAPLLAGCAQRYLDGIEADRMHSATWRRFAAAQAHLEEAFLLLADDDARRELTTVRPALLAAVETVHELRTAAVRALASSSRPATLIDTLRNLHSEAGTVELSPILRTSVNLDRLRTELELTLARFGEPELLSARIEGLRSQVERFEGSQIAVTARIASRPDIAARGEVAHLLLRSGDAAGAEREWEVVLREARAVAASAKADSQRGVVASFVAAVYYNLACAQSLQLKLTKAGQSLEAARANGYRDYNWMLEDGDLEALRDTPQFHAWFSRVAPPAAVDRLAAAGR